MVDAETGDIVDMLESRESEEVSEWLATFPSIEIVSRDGSTLYAKAISTETVSKASFPVKTYNTSNEMWTQKA